MLRRDLISNGGEGLEEVGCCLSQGGVRVASELILQCML